MTSKERRAELEAAVQARRDLGPDYEDALIESFVDGIDAEIDRRVAARMPERSRGTAPQSFIVGLASLGAGIPITAISASMAQLPGLVTAWVGIGIVNVAVALGQRRR